MKMSKDNGARTYVTGSIPLLFSEFFLAAISIGIVAPIISQKIVDHFIPRSTRNSPLSSCYYRNAIMNSTMIVKLRTK
jgi:hypothetical protein